MDKKYDYLIVGAGPYGSVCAYELTKRGKSCLVIDKRNTIGGNCYTENNNGIHVHKYGAHIFHTNDKYIWDYINQFAEFKQYTHNVIANNNGEIFTLPFNMWTFKQLWGITSPQDAIQKIEEQRYKGPITNLEEQALSMVGTDIYEKLIKGYTEKQWNKPCTELPPSIIKRLPVRFTWDSNYFNDKYTGIPIGGYTQIFEKMLKGIEVLLGKDYFNNREYYDNLADKIIYTGPIDRYFDYQFGKLDYRSLSWSNVTIDEDNFQGNPVVNYTDSKTFFTRILEHKWFDYQGQKGTIISYEFPEEYNGHNEPYYPIRDNKNTQVYNKYNELTKGLNNVIFGGRLATYVYYDMHQIIAQALKMISDIYNHESFTKESQKIV
jgi:UDP-galactopyranose mutase